MIIYFLLIGGAIVFFGILVMVISRIGRSKRCPHCARVVPSAALVCPYCTRNIP